MMEYKLFTTRFCHKCPAMKEFMSGQTKVTGSFVDCSSPEGLELAKKFNITRVPTVMFFEGDEVKHTCHEKDEVEGVLNTI
ncbi:hypothetical protein KY363_06620 [Candidatus Woesearchaeota archaeon]|nr:hypothetical protein [Candidatus Woesearchaeota archaeon]